MRYVSHMDLPRESVSVSVHSIDPRQDPRWASFIEKHPRASVFHSVPWLDALHRTYGYEPIVYTTSPPGAALQNGVVFCSVKSWVTGRRLVSLPFSDHCEPLIDTVAEFELIFGYLQAHLLSGGWKYVEVRPANAAPTSPMEDWKPSSQYYLHSIDLRPQEEALFRNFHKSSVQHRVRRAVREGLVYESGRSDALLRKFYRLMFLTRRRHRIPPQPEKWFRNLVACMGDALEIHVASHENKAVASIMTLRFKDTVTYKYGGSNQAYNGLGSMPFLLWRAIQGTKAHGAQVFDLGRSDCDHHGLIDFKDRWADARTLLTYWRFPARDLSMNESRAFKLTKSALGFLPDSLFKIAGEILYRHIG